MAFNTRGLSWLSPNSAAIVRDFRNTSERLGFKAAVTPETWAEIEREHIRASSALCHLVADLERFAREHRYDPYDREDDRLPRVEYDSLIDAATKRMLLDFARTELARTRKKQPAKRAAKKRR